MGANQSKENSEAGSSRCFGCCGARDSTDNLLDKPEKHLRLSKGRLRHGDRSQSRIQLRSPEPTTPGQPTQRPEMSATSLSNPMFQVELPSGHSNEGDSPWSRSLSRQSTCVKPRARGSDAGEYALDRNLSMDEGSTPQLPSDGLVLDEVLNKRLSPLPDFMDAHADEMSKIDAAEPWVTVRNIAENTPSRRSSFLDQSASPRTSLYQRPATSRNASSPKVGASTAASAYPNRVRARSSPGERKTSAFAEDIPEVPRRNTPSPALRLRTDLSTSDKPKPSLISNFSNLHRTASPDGTSSRSSSPKRKTSLRKRVRSRTTSSPERGRNVEDAVRELEEIIHLKREGELQTPVSATSQKRKSILKAHRPAIAPKMVMDDVSSTLLNEIGSGLSRPLSEEELFKADLSNTLPLSAISQRGSSRRASRRKASWPGTLDSDPASPHHSGTFFFSRQSLDEIIAPRGTARTVASRTNANGSNQKPLPAKPTPVKLPPALKFRDEEPHSPTIGLPFIPFHKPNLSNASQSTTATGISLSSALFPSAPATPAATAASELPALPKMSKKFPNPPRHVPHISNDSFTPSKPKPAPTLSRTDTSSAVQAARQRAADRVASEEAAGMGLGIGGMLSAQDLCNVVEMDVWDAKPAHQHPSRSRNGSVATHKTDSILVEPSMSPNVSTEGPESGGVERAMSVAVPKGHVAQLVRTQSGKTVVKKNPAPPKNETDTDTDRPRPLAGAPRKISKESNVYSPSQNEARLRKSALKTSQSSSPTRPKTAPKPTTTAKQHSPPEHAYTGDFHRPISMRSRAGSASSQKYGAEQKPENVEFGMDLQRSASARRLREVEVQVSRMEEAQDVVPPMPVIQRANSGSPVVGPAGGLLLPVGGGQNVRASQIGMAC